MVTIQLRQQSQQPPANNRSNRHRYKGRQQIQNRQATSQHNIPAKIKAASGQTSKRTGYSKESGRTATRTANFRAYQNPQDPTTSQPNKQWKEMITNNYPSTSTRKATIKGADINLSTKYQKTTQPGGLINIRGNTVTYPRHTKIGLLTRKFRTNQLPVENQKGTQQFKWLLAKSKRVGTHPHHWYQ
jgi:hypothetical protein